MITFYIAVYVHSTAVGLKTKMGTPTALYPVCFFTNLLPYVFIGKMYMREELRTGTARGVANGIVSQHPVRSWAGDSGEYYV